MHAKIALALTALLFAPQLAGAVAPVATAQTFPSPNIVTPDQAAAGYQSMVAQGLLPGATIVTTANIGTLAPVQSVNTQTGAVVLPALVRQVNDTPLPVSTTTGNVGYTFATPFTGPALPTCYIEIVSANTNYVFSQPVTTAKSLTGVTMNVLAALKLLNISLGALTVWGPPPSGTTANIACLGT